MLHCKRSYKPGSLGSLIVVLLHLEKLIIGSDIKDTSDSLTSRYGIPFIDTRVSVTNTIGFVFISLLAAASQLKVK